MAAGKTTTRPPPSRHLHQLSLPRTARASCHRPHYGPRQAAGRVVILALNRPAERDPSLSIPRSDARLRRLPECRAGPRGGGRSEGRDAELRPQQRRRAHLAIRSSVLRRDPPLAPPKPPPLRTGWYGRGHWHASDAARERESAFCPPLGASSAVGTTSFSHTHTHTKTRRPDSNPGPWAPERQCVRMFVRV